MSNKQQLQVNNSKLRDDIPQTIQNLPNKEDCYVVTIDGEKVRTPLDIYHLVMDLRLEDLPEKFSNGQALLLDGEIHILYGYNHYKWNGNKWNKASTLPYHFYNGQAVVLNGEIHIMGTNGTDIYRKHYKWNGLSWIEASTLPFSLYGGSVVVLNDEIHIMGGYGEGNNDNQTKHYKWNGTAWTSVSTLPYIFYFGSAVVFNNEIHIMGSVSGALETKHYKWNGTAWTSVSTLPIVLRALSCAFVFKGKINIAYTGERYAFNSVSWNIMGKFPCSPANGRTVIFNNKIHLLGSVQSGYESSHYVLGVNAYREEI